MRKLPVILRNLLVFSFLMIPGALANQSIIITEIMYDPRSSESAPVLTEWVEIYNVGSTQVDLAGWTLSDEDGVPFGGISSGILQAGEVGVITPLSEADFRAAWSTAANAKILTSTWSDGQALDNSPDQFNEILELIDDQKTVVDRVNIDDEDPWPNPGGSESIYLKRDALHGRLNDGGSNWWKSSTGVDGAIASTVTNIFNQSDIGSPGVVNFFFRGTRIFTHDFNNQNDWTDNFSPTVFNVAEGSRILWSNGELTNPWSGIVGSRIFTYTAEEFPILRNGDKMEVSVDFKLDTSVSGVISEALFLFLSPSGWDAGTRQGANNPGGIFELRGSYGGSPAEGWLAGVNAEPDGNNTEVSSGDEQFVIDSVFNMNLTAFFTDLGNDEIEVTSVLTGGSLGGPLSVTGREPMSNNTLRDPTWQVGVYVNNAAITSLDNFEIRYKSATASNVTVNVFPGANAISWDADTLPVVDVFRSFDGNIWAQIGTSAAGGLFIDENPASPNGRAAFYRIEPAARYNLP